MAEETNAPAPAEGAGTAAQPADTADVKNVSDTQQTETKARGADGKFAAKPAEPAADETPEWRKVLGKRSKDFTGKTQLARSYVEAEQRLSRSLVMPGKDASPEEVAKFDAGLRRIMGVPEKAEDFKVEAPEGWGDEHAPMVADVVKLAHENRVPPAFVEKLLGWYAGIEAASTAHMEKAALDFQANSIAGKRKEWGSDYDENLAYANAGMKQFGEGTDFGNVVEMTFKQAAEKYGDARIGDHPDFLEVFARVGREIGDPTVKLQTTPGASSVASIESRIGTLYDEMYKPGTSEGRKAEINAELNGLNEKLYGTRPAYGAPRAA